MEGVNIGDICYDIDGGRTYEYVGSGKWLLEETIRFFDQINKIIFFANKRLSHYELLEISEFIPKEINNLAYILDHIKKQ